MQPPSARLVRAVVAASIVGTAFHFTDNAISIEDYAQPDWVTQAVVVISWPLFSALGIAGYLLYRQGNFPLANWFLFAYAYTGLSSLAHFLYASPDQFTTRGVASIFTDAIAGTAVLALALWSFAARRRPAPDSS